MKDKIRVCLIGAGFIGRKYALAYKSHNSVKLQVVCDSNENLAKELAKEYGFERVETNWRKAISAKDVDLVCVCVPNNIHYEIVSEAIKYGKHISCEKPLGLNSDESEKLLWLEKEKGIIANCCYNIIRIPAIVYAKKIIDSGELGEFVCFRGSYDNDRLVDPKSPFEWRMSKKNANGGSLCDLAINILAVSQFLVGDITSVCGMTNVIHKKRKDLKGNIIEVENDDIAQFICEYKNGAMGYIASNRVAPGSKQDMKFEIHLTKGAIKFSLECMNEIMIYKVGNNGYSIVISDENGFYCLPGGHIEIGEDSKEAVVREFKEETGIDVKVEQLISITENFFTRKNGKKIHEISFYYILKSYDEFNIEKSEYDVVEIDKDKIMEHHFKWIDICNIDNEDFRPIKIKEKIKNGNYNFEPIIIK